MATIEDLRALVEAQAPSLSDAVKTELSEVAFRLSHTHPDTNENVVARAFEIVQIPPAPPAAPTPPTFDQEVTALLDGHSPPLTAEQKSVALMVVTKVKAQNPSASAETCVHVALRKVL